MNKSKDKVISWLQISDLHIFESSATAIFHSELKKICGGKTDFLLITGDLHQYEKKPKSGIGRYEKTIEELEEVMKNLGLSSKRDVFMVPGNHDAVDFRGKKKLVAEIDEKAQRDGNFDCYNGKEAKLEASFEVFQEFVREFYGAEDIYGGKEIHNHTQIWNDKIEILHLNTAFTCNGDNKRKEIVNLIELSKVKRQRPDLPLITIAHHSYYRIHECQRPILKRFLSDLNTKAYLCGDEHRESKESLELEEGNVPVIVCGKSAIDSGDHWSNVDVIFYQWHYTEPQGPVEVQLYRWNPLLPGLEPSYTLGTKKDVEKSIQTGVIRWPRFYLKKDAAFVQMCGDERKEEKPSGKRFNLKKAAQDTAQQVRESLLYPWLKRESASFSLIYDKLYMEPQIKHLNQNCTMPLKDFWGICEKEKNQKIWVLGDAGAGKSVVLKKLFLDKIKADEQTFFLNALELLDDNKNDKSKYIQKILEGKRKCPRDLWLVIDGIDEAFASDVGGFRLFVKQVEKLPCKVFVGCRSQYFEEFAEATSFHRIELQKWSETLASHYVEEYFEKIGKSELVSVYSELYKTEEYIRCFAQNPFHLSLLLYLIENPDSDGIKLNNIYSLYSEFFRQWMSREHSRNTGAKDEAETIYKELWGIARRLYDRQEVVTEVSDTAILGLLNTQLVENNRKLVRSFYHRSFMEFLLARAVIEAMKKCPDELVLIAKRNNRSDVDAFVKAGFAVESYVQKNAMVQNMIGAYWKSKKEPEAMTEDEHFYVENQIVYYMTRMKGMNAEPVETFIKSIYSNENQAIMRQGIAYGAANLGIFDIALQFARGMNAGSVEDLTNRSWTLVFYGDMPDEDPLHYVDDGTAPWNRSRAARLRRLQGIGKKECAFRMFDLQIMYGFLESRGWKGLSEGELKIIESCETDIEGYPAEVVDFLAGAKEKLVREYRRRLHYV